MNSAKQHKYREVLEELHERVGGEVNYVLRSIHEGVQINDNISAAPVHLADIAGEAVDADVEVLQTERGILQEIDAALSRIEEGTFGTCIECGATISETRLKAIPYAPQCVQCARSSQQS